jgi:hypothetical protein
MAKAKHGAKSQAIREYLTANSAAKGNDVVAALKANGIKVSSQMVSTIKARMGAGPKKRGRRKKSASAKRNGAMISLGVLVQAKKLAESLGGVEKAKEAMDALAKLQ